MLSKRVTQLLDIPQLQETGRNLAQTIHQAVLNSGEQVRNWVDVLHGTWLGHPLHPMLTDVVVGAWMLGASFDLLSLVNCSKHAESAADALTLVGNYAALPTILSGLADYSTIPRPAASMGLTHAAANNIGFALQLASASARSSGDRDRAIALSSVAVILLTAGAYLGGHLVYDQKVGVKHTDAVREPETWTPVLDAESLQDQEPQQVDAAGNPVLLYRKGDQIMAIGAICPHAGGPLAEGQFYGDCVQCPWHDSVFNLNDGRIVHGPTTYPVPNYEARLRDGQVEVRLAPTQQRA